MIAEDIKKTIQSAYSNWLKSNGFRARLGQRQMIADIARTLCRAGHDDSGTPIAVIEAGTGTGKTIAYVLAALPIARATGKTLLISTATVALQEQIVNKDLPDLTENGELNFSYTLAKGRGRYACLAKLDGLLRDADGQQAALALLPDESPPLGQREKALYQRMVVAVAEDVWNGDRDSWPNAIDDPVWGAITTDRYQCSGNRCSFIRDCPFFKARADLDQVDCIVANHDLVLSDLGLGGGVTLPPPEEIIYVFDEAHHLPDKVRSHFSSHVRIDQFEQWLGQCEQTLQNLSRRLSGQKDVETRIAASLPIVQSVRDALAAVQLPLKELREASETLREDGDSWTLRLVNGCVPARLADQAAPLAELSTVLAAQLAEVEENLGILLEDARLAVKFDIQALYTAIGQNLGRIEAAARLWQAYSQRDEDEDPPQARWLRGATDEPSAMGLYSSPIVASNLLYDLLWTRCHAAVLTSATLTALGRFDRLRMHAGLPEDCCYSILPSPFCYQEAAVLEVPALPSDPSNPAAHTEAVIAWLDESLDRKSASLVLFASRRQMHETYEAIAEPLRELVLLQDHYSKQELLRLHRQRIDAGKGSAIFGLASFSEGIDLPGQYCRHVVIAKIPFAVPGEPVEEALAEWVERNGGNAFMEITVPDAALRLVQASGRLLRSETDSGRITLLDRRIISRHYGRQMLDSLPPFRRDVA